MPYCFIQPPTRVPFKNPTTIIDDPFGDRINEEVAAMNQQHREDERLREAGHNDR